MRNLREYFAVAFLSVCFVIDIACLLYGDFITARIIAQVGEPGPAERKITRDNIGIIMKAFSH